MPDDFWRKTFEEATETPPLRVWDAIERRLDESNHTKILPLWGLGLVSSRPMAWAASIAAAVTLLLIGWWAVGTAPTGQSSLSVAQRIEPTLRASSPHVSSPKPATPEISSIDKSQEQASERVASVTKSARPSVKPPTKSSPDRQLVASSKVTLAVGSLPQGRSITKATVLPASMMKKSVVQNSSPGIASDLPPSGDGRIVIVSSGYGRTVATSSFSEKSTGFVTYGFLSGRSLRLRDLAQIHRIVWFRPTEPSMKPEEIKSKQKNRDVWASASFMSGAFNPMAAVKTASSVGMANNVSLDALKSVNLSQQSVSSRPGFSVAYQAGAGLQLNDHWSLESGIGYLAGRSTIETPAQLSVASIQGITGQTSNSSNLYLDALRNSIHSNGNGLAYATVPQANFANNYVSVSNNYNSQTRQVLTSDYQYMQVPVQVGYQLRPKKRLSLALLGGLITNIFIRNTIDNEVVITTKDGVYRPISLAAAMGARIRYRPTQQWSASVAGMYQPSLGLGTQSDAQVQSHPTTTGMSFGVDYHF